MRKIILLHFSFFCLSYSQDGVLILEFGMIKVLL